MEEAPEYEMKFIRNYLSLPRYKNAALYAFGMVALCAVLSNIYWGNLLNAMNLLSANHNNVFIGKEYWRLFSTTFLHGDLKHLLSNSYMLFVMGYFTSAFFGKWIFISLSVVLGALINYCVLLSLPGATSLVGISGVVYFLWGFWFINYLFIQRQMSFPIRLLKILGVAIILLFPTTFSIETSYLAHLYGFLIGIPTGAIYFLFNRKRIFSYEEYTVKILHTSDDENLDMYES